MLSIKSVLLLALTVLGVASHVQIGHAQNLLTVSATLTAKGDVIEKGVTWRVFASSPGTDEKLPALGSANGGEAQFNLPTGTYFVHAGFGRASATKRITLDGGNQNATFVIDAGGLILNAQSEGKKVAPNDLRFSVYGFERDENGDRELIAKDIRANRLVRLNTGTYHVVSTYGSINASVRADLEVDAGKVTKATLQHRGAKIMLKLVSKSGGNPIANTAWTVLTEQGEKVFESNAVSPSLILSEGRYEASVRNGDQTYVHNFDIKAGENGNVEVLLGS